MKQRFNNDGNEMDLPSVAEEAGNDLGGEGSTDAVDENGSPAMGRQDSLMEFAQGDEDALDYAVSTVRSERGDAVEPSVTEEEGDLVEKSGNGDESTQADLTEIAAENPLDHAVSITPFNKKEDEVSTTPNSGGITPFRTPDANDGSAAPVTPRESEHEDNFKTPERSKTPEESPAKWGMGSSNSENQSSDPSPVTSGGARAAGPAPEGVDQTWWEALTASPNRLLASWSNRYNGLNPGQLEISPEGENSGAALLEGELPENHQSSCPPSAEVVAEVMPENHQASCPPLIAASTVGSFAVILLGVYFSGGFGDGSGSDL